MVRVVEPALVAIVCVAIGVFSQSIGKRLGLLDAPDGGRKNHHLPAAVVGGLMFMACAVVIIADMYISMPVQDQRIYVVAAIVLSHGVLGITDDKYSIPATARLVYSLSLTAAVLATDRTLVIREVHLSFGPEINLDSRVSYFVSLIFIVGSVYAVNMIDGINGVLAIYSLLVLVFVIPWLAHGSEIYFACAGITLLIFLGFNMAGGLFAGDGGSYTVGAAVAVLLLHLYDREGATGRPLPIEFIAIAVFVPATDACRVSVGRLRQGRWIFHPDRNHLHHLLSDRLGGPIALVSYATIVGVPMLAAISMPRVAWIALVLSAGLYTCAVLSCQSRSPSAKTVGYRD
jgi:UDP-GlcNAc:undecaprenyl-phosphate GlcNAc-1-phosphate transferase